MSKNADDIRRRDIAVFWQESASFPRLAAAVLVFAAMAALATRTLEGAGAVAACVVLALIVIAGHFFSAWHGSIAKRFIDNQFKLLWDGCSERRVRFHQVLYRSRHTPTSGLVEMPKTIDQVGESVYRALRRADFIRHELKLTEKGLSPLPPPVHGATNRDPQAQELLRAADRNLVEYRQSVEAVLNGVRRTEAQAAVYMTTLDTLRMKVLGYRLAGTPSELPSGEFLALMNEAKMQLNAIDRALEELDFSTMTGLSGPPPPPPGLKLSSNIPNHPLAQEEATEQTQKTTGQG